MRDAQQFLYDLDRNAPKSADSRYRDEDTELLIATAMGVLDLYDIALKTGQTFQPEYEMSRLRAALARLKEQ